MLGARDVHDAIIQDNYAAIVHSESLATDLRWATRMQLVRVASSLGDVIHDLRAYIQGVHVRAREGAAPWARRSSRWCGRSSRRAG